MCIWGFHQLFCLFGGMRGKVGSMAVLCMPLMSRMWFCPYINETSPPLLYDVESNINIPLAVPPLFFVMLRTPNLMMVFAVYHGTDMDRIQTLPGHACLRQQASNEQCN